MNEIMIKTTGLSKVYKKNCVVDRVSMTINKGDIYGFIGVNGAGKTTFMRMLCGLARPTEGYIELLGKTSDDLPSARKKIGAIIENPALYPNMTAHENLLVQAKYLDMPSNTDTKEKIENLLKLVGLTNIHGKKATDFSLGMKQRLGLALTLLGEPELVILDEPTIGLDPMGVFELRQLLLKLNAERNLTILFSSHNLSEMTQLATRYGFIHNGKLIKEIDAQKLHLDFEKSGNNLESYFLNLLNRHYKEVE